MAAMDLRSFTCISLSVRLIVTSTVKMGERIHILPFTVVYSQL